MNRRTLPIIWHLASRPSRFFGVGTVPACRTLGISLPKDSVDGSDPIYRGFEGVFGKWVMDSGEWFTCVGMFMLFLAAMDQADFETCIKELQAFA